MSVLAEHAGFSAHEDDEFKVSVRMIGRCKLLALSLLHALLDAAAHGETSLCRTRLESFVVCS